MSDAAWEPIMTQQTKYWNRKFGIGALVVVVLLAVGLSCGYRWIEEANADRYACQGAAYVLVYFMQTHEGRWPKSWDDLRANREEYRRRNQQGNQSEISWGDIEIDPIARRVEIDFTFDSAAFMANGASAPLPRLVWPRADRCALNGEGWARRTLEASLRGEPGTPPAMTQPTTRP
jgi:hypothetical protein